MRLQSTTKQASLLPLETPQTSRHLNTRCFHHKSSSPHSCIHPWFLLPASIIALYVRKNRTLQHPLGSLRHGNHQYPRSAHGPRSLSRYELTRKRYRHHPHDSRIRLSSRASWHSGRRRTDSLQPLANDGRLRNISGVGWRLHNA